MSTGVDPIGDQLEEGGIADLLGGMAPDWLLGNTETQQRLRQGDLGAIPGALGEVVGGAGDFTPVGDLGTLGQLGSLEAESGQHMSGWTQAALLAGLGLGAVGLGAHAFGTVRRAAHAADAEGGFMPALRRQLAAQYHDERGAAAIDALVLGWSRWANSDWNNGIRQHGFLTTELLNSRTIDDVVENLWVAGRGKQSDVESFTVARMAGLTAEADDATAMADRTVARLDLERPQPRQLAALRTFVDVLDQKLTERVPGHEGGAIQFGEREVLPVAWELPKFVTAWNNGVFGDAASGPGLKQVRADVKALFTKPEELGAEGIDRLTDFIAGFAGVTAHVQDPELRWDPDISMASVHVGEDGDITPVFDKRFFVDPMGERPEAAAGTVTAPVTPLTRRVRNLKLRDLYPMGVENIEKVLKLASPEEVQRGLSFYSEEGRKWATDRVMTLRDAGYMTEQNLDNAVEHYLGVTAAISASMPWDKVVDGKVVYQNLDMADRLIRQISDGWYGTEDEFLTQYGGAKAAARNAVKRRIDADPTYRPKGIVEYDENGDFVRFRNIVKGDPDRLEGISRNEALKAIRMVRGGKSFNEVMFESQDPTMWGKVLKGLKTRNFGTNLIAPDDEFAATIDRHAFAIFAGWDTGVEKPPLDSLDNYMAVADAYRQVAAKYGYTPNQLQAITWHVWRRLKDVGLDGTTMGGEGRQAALAPHTDLGGGVRTDEAGRIYIDDRVRNIIQGASPTMSPAAMLRKLGGRLGPDLPLDSHALRRVLKERQGVDEVEPLAPGEAAHVAVLAHGDDSLSIGGDDLDALDDHFRVATPVQLTGELSPAVWTRGWARQVDLVDRWEQQASAAVDQFDQPLRFRGFIHPDGSDPWVLEPGNRIAVRGLDPSSEQALYEMLKGEGLSARSMGDHLESTSDYSFDKDIGGEAFVRKPDPALLERFLTERQWATLSSVTDKFRAADDARLVAVLKERGYTPLRQEGVYDGEVEPSYLVVGMGPGEAAEIGRMFKQDSVGTRYGLIGTKDYNANQLLPWAPDRSLFGAAAAEGDRSEVFLTPSGSKRWPWQMKLAVDGWFGDAGTVELTTAGSAARRVRKPTRGMIIDLGDVAGRADTDRAVRLIEKFGQMKQVDLDVALHVHGQGVVPEGYVRAWEHHFTDPKGQRFSYRTAAKPDARTPNETPVWVPARRAAELPTTAWQGIERHATVRPELAVSSGAPDTPDGIFNEQVGVVFADDNQKLGRGGHKTIVVWAQEGRLPVIVPAPSARAGVAALTERFSMVDPNQMAVVRLGRDRLEIATRPSMYDPEKGDALFAARVSDVLAQVGLDRSQRSVSVLRDSTSGGTS